MTLGIVFGMHCVFRITKPIVSKATKTGLFCCNLWQETISAATIIPRRYYAEKQEIKQPGPERAVFGASSLFDDTEMKETILEESSVKTSLSSNTKQSLKKSESVHIFLSFPPHLPCLYLCIVDDKYGKFTL